MRKKTDEFLDFHDRIGRVIRRLRHSQGLTLQEISDKTGVSLGYISQIELGNNSPSISTLFLLFKHLCVDWIRFFEMVKEEELVDKIREGVKTSTLTRGEL